MPIFAAIPGALAAIGGGSALAGGALLAAPVVAGAIGANASKQATAAATKAQTQTAANNNALQTDIYNRNSATLAPFVQQGQGYNTQVNALLGSNPFKSSTGASFETSPFYEFLQKEGMRGTNAQFGDAVNSGGRYKALQDRLTNIAGGFQNQWFNQDQATLANQNQSTGQYLNALTGQQGVGLQAAGAQAGVGVNYANGVSNNNWQAANAQSNGALVNGANQNALMSGISGLAGQFLGQGGFGQQRQSSYAPPPAPAQTGWTPPYNSLSSVY